MGVTIELQNLGDAQLCREITVLLEHVFSDRQGPWRVSITGSRATDNWDLRVEGANGLSVLTVCPVPPVGMSPEPSVRLFCGFCHQLNPDRPSFHETR